MTQLGLMISGRTRPGKRDDLYALYREHLAPRALANDAQRVVVWMADAADEDVFHLFELYADRAAFERNAQADWFGVYMTAAGPLLDGQPAMRVTDPWWAKGVELE